jgi:CubicO group peptidase (beta-lactamase class C family)
MIARACLALAAAAGFALATQAATPTFEAGVDAAAAQVLKSSGVPSASVAVIRDDRIVLIKAYGFGHLAPPLAANTAMRYSIGSVSKEFLAATIMLLIEQGKLTLDDPVAKFMPALTDASQVRVRDLLDHTSGYRDFWPQDYVPPAMLKPITSSQIIRDWATLPLDFAPGTQYQYSNTGYTIAGAIVEQVSGQPLMDLLHQRIFEPLGMRSVLDVNLGRLEPGDAQGYLRYTLGPPRPAPKEGPGWLFAAGGLAMTAEDLARWDLALLDGKLLAPSSLAAMASTRVLANGTSANYGLGLDVYMESGRRVLGHSGEVSGFVSQNTLYPDQKAAIVVLTNQDASSAAQELSKRIRDLLFLVQSPQTARQLERARKIFANLQQGTIDRTLFTPNGNDYFNAQALLDAKQSLAPLGVPKSFEQTTEYDRGGMRLRRFEIKFPKRTLVVIARELPDGRFEQYQLRPE